MLPLHKPDSRLALEAFAIPESQRDAVAKGIKKVVLAVASSVAYAKALYLIEQMVPCVPFIVGRLVEGAFGVFDQPAMYVTRHRNRPFVLAHRGEFRVNRHGAHL